MKRQCIRIINAFNCLTRLRCTFHLDTRECLQGSIKMENSGAGFLLPQNREKQSVDSRVALFQSSPQPSKGHLQSSQPAFPIFWALLVWSCSCSEIFAHLAPTQWPGEWINEWIHKAQQSYMGHLGQLLKESRIGWNINYTKNFISNIKG